MRILVAAVSKACVSAVAVVTSAPSIVGVMVSLAGCGQPGIPTYVVTGTVLVNGKPVDQGDIVFVPFDERIAPEGGRIVAGKYAMRAKAGRNRVEIMALDLGPNTVMIDGVPIAKNYLPPKYNAESVLDGEVKPHNSNQFDFELNAVTSSGK